MIRSKIIEAKVARGEKPSDFEIICEQLGEPGSVAPLAEEIGLAIDQDILPIDRFARPCLQFSFEQVWETLSRVATR